MAGLNRIECGSQTTHHGGFDMSCLPH